MTLFHISVPQRLTRVINLQKRDNFPVLLLNDTIASSPTNHLQLWAERVMHQSSAPSFDSRNLSKRKNTSQRLSDSAVIDGDHLFGTTRVHTTLYYLIHYPFNPSFQVGTGRGGGVKFVFWSSVDICLLVVSSQMVFDLKSCVFWRMKKYSFLK